MPTDPAAINQNNLGNKVVSRSIDWRQLVINAWGSEYMAPDHGIYQFSGGAQKDSTDKTSNGIYNGGIK